MRQRSKAECRGGGERAVFLALPSLGLYNGTPEMLAVHRYLLLTVSEPKSGSTSQALSVIPETIPLGTNATSLTPSSALPSGADPYPGTRNEHREPQRWTTSAWSSFIFRAMPPAGQEERRPVLPPTKGSRGPALPHQLHGWGRDQLWPSCGCSSCPRGVAASP